jgi:hypothetical protein
MSQRRVEDLTAEDYRRLASAVEGPGLEQMQITLYEIGLSDFDDAHADAARLRPVLAVAISRGIGRALDEE